MEPIPHKVRVKIVEKLVYPEMLSSAKTIWGRELKILKTLTAGKYEDAEFWLNLGLGFKLRSLAWFNLPDGKAALERAWKLHQMVLAQAQPAGSSHSGLDTESNSRIVESSTTESPPRSRKQSVLEWADSE